MAGYQHPYRPQVQYVTVPIQMPEGYPLYPIQQQQAYYGTPNFFLGNAGPHAGTSHPTHSPSPSAINHGGKGKRKRNRPQQWGKNKRFGQHSGNNSGHARHPQRFQRKPKSTSTTHLPDHLALATSVSGVFGKLMKNRRDLTYEQFKALPLKEQLYSFVAGPEERTNRDQIVTDIESFLKPHYPHCKLYPFGSHLTGLGDSASDMDVYIDINGDGGKALELVNKKCIQDIRDEVLRLLRKEKCPTKGVKITIKGSVTKMDNKAVLIRMTHAGSGIKCDLSFANRLSVRNTELLKFYIDFDPRVRPLLIFIRTWAKYIGVADERKLKKYAISLMVLVYLTKERIIPSVHLLQKLSANERKSQRVSINSHEINGWDGSFCTDLDIIKQNFDIDPFGKATILPVELAKGFFKMYGDLDYFKYMVCPLLGEFILKSQFLPETCQNLEEPLLKVVMTNSNLGRELKLQNMNKPLSIQDPFMLNFNVGGVTNSNILNRFQKACKQSFLFLENKMGQIESILDLFLLDESPRVNLDEKEIERKVECVKLEMDEERKSEISDADSHAPEEPLASSSLHANKISSKNEQNEGMLNLELCVDKDFTQILLRKLAQMKSLENNHDEDEKKSVMQMLVSCLWADFAIKFLREMFEDGLKLRFEEANLHSPTSDSDHSEHMSSDIVYGEELLKLLEEECGNLKRTRGSEDQVLRFQEKIDGVIQAFSENYYKKVWTVAVCYPFWNRENPKVNKRYGPYNVNPLEAEEKVSEKILEQFLLESWQRKPHSTDAEEQTSPAKRPRLQDFVQFKMRFQIKLDAKLGERPSLKIMFQDFGGEAIASGESRGLAEKTLMNILDSSFSAYQLYRLTKWLKL